MAVSSVVTYFVKPSGQDVLDPVYPHGYVRWRKAGDFCNRHCIHVFQIRDDHLAVERFELSNQCRQTIQIEALVRVVRIFFGNLFELFQRYKILKNPALAHDMRRGDMMSNAIDPGAQGTTRIEPVEAPPQLKMNFLDEVASLFRIHLVSARQPIERGAELVRRFLVPFILARGVGQNRLGSSHIQGSRRKRNFLTE
jgi:hypothetical protein